MMKRRCKQINSKRAKLDGRVGSRCLDFILSYPALCQERGNYNRWFGKPTFKLDEEAGMQQISGLKVPAKLRKEWGNYQKLVCHNAEQVG